MLGQARDTYLNPKPGPRTRRCLLDRLRCLGTELPETTNQQVEEPDEEAEIKDECNPFEPAPLAAAELDAVFPKCEGEDQHEEKLGCLQYSGSTVLVHAANMRPSRPEIATAG